MAISQKSQQVSVLPLIIEIIAGLLGFLGAGWIFSGKIFTGLKIMFTYWIAIIALGFGTSMVLILTFGFASLLYLILAPVTITIYFAAPLISANKLYNQLRQANNSYRQPVQSSREMPQEKLAPSLERYINERAQAQSQRLGTWQLVIVIGLIAVAIIIFGSFATLLYGYIGGLQ